MTGFAILSGKDLSLGIPSKYTSGIALGNTLFVMLYKTPCSNNVNTSFA